jgi:hypothetical protein
MVAQEAQDACKACAASGLPARSGSQLGDAAPAGVYFCVLQSGDTRVAGRVVLIR